MVSFYLIAKRFCTKKLMKHINTSGTTSMNCYCNIAKHILQHRNKGQVCNIIICFCCNIS
jgi:tRNA G46 methylase TrmB